ncbi:MAG: hypothetical protein NVS4B3_19110 [Gemmatimonadaceae bacterium]
MASALSDGKHHRGITSTDCLWVCKARRWLRASEQSDGWFPVPGLAIHPDAAAPGPGILTGKKRGRILRPLLGKGYIAV